MTETRTPPATDAVFQRHAGLIAATESAVDALPALSPDASPQSFPALKASERPGASE
ncbi:hypothetical protein N8I71_04470 [Roseibacterium sp. SDUM158016]|uniref:hypothetical protein n=1 Tax=Roseicyclus sediminis TaxID=2980997 RepID=UPI0021D1211A|nr:hypothetical protein [Roseibacterium sp. SDUM158016]MCU4652070.1 hypothetical protein [Roseibacterium sp. SDUM158016]